MSSVKVLTYKTVAMLEVELGNIPDKFDRPFSSVHEGYGILLEEVRELEMEVFWGEKGITDKVWKDKMRREALQVAAMAIRFVQELT